MAFSYWANCPHEPEGHIAFGRVVKVHVAEYEPPAGRLHGLLDGLLMFHIPAVPADVSTNECTGASGLDVGES